MREGSNRRANLEEGVIPPTGWENDEN